MAERERERRRRGESRAELGKQVLEILLWFFSVLVPPPSFRMGLTLNTVILRTPTGLLKILEIVSLVS